MLVRAAAPQRASTSGIGGEEVDEEEAALRIQAIYRGKKSRQRQQVRQVNAGLGASKVRSRNPRELKVLDGTPTAAQATAVRQSSKLSSASPTRQPSKETFSIGHSPRATFTPLEGLTTPAGALATSGASMRRSFSSCSGDDQNGSMEELPHRGTYSLMRLHLEAQPTDRPSLHMLRVSAYLMFEEPGSSRSAQVLSVSLLAAIITSIVCFMIETMPELKHVPEDVWMGIEVCCTIVFTIEYLARLAVCGVAGVTPWQFVKNTMNIFDLLAILPFYIWVAVRSFKLAKALGVLRIVRLVRLFRIFKLGRYSVGLQLMAEALQNSSQALWVLSFFMCIGILLFSSAVYYVEKIACPDAGDLRGMPHRDFHANSTLTEWDRYVGDCRVSTDGKHATHGLCCDEHGSPRDFPSIVEAFWWAIVTMTTVGYGEVYPRTELGRLVATATMLSGILLIALPVAIIGRKFQEVYELKEYREALAGDPNDLVWGPEQSSASIDADFSRPCPKNTIQSSEGPTLQEMSRRLRLMKLQDPCMMKDAMELAEELDEANDMQMEIDSMQREEKAWQAEVVGHFDMLLKRLTELLDDGDAKKGKMNWGGLGLAQKGLTQLASQAGKHQPNVDGDTSLVTPLPPPGDPPPSGDLAQPQGRVVRPPSPPSSVPQPPGIVQSRKDAHCATIS